MTSVSGTSRAPSPEDFRRASDAIEFTAARLDRIGDQAQSPVTKAQTYAKAGQYRAMAAFVRRVEHQQPVSKIDFREFYYTFEEWRADAYGGGFVSTTPIDVEVMDRIRDHVAREEEVLLRKERRMDAEDRERIKDRQRRAGSRERPISPVLRPYIDLAKVRGYWRRRKAHGGYTNVRRHDRRVIRRGVPWELGP